MKIDRIKLSKLLKRIYLGGLITETVIDFKSSAVQAIDITNSIYLNCFEDIKANELGEVGIGDLALLCKYLDSIKEDIDIEKKDNRLILKSNVGELKFLTTDPEFIATAINKDNPEKLLEDCILTIDLSEDTAKNILSYSSFVKTKAIDFNIAKDGNVELSGGLESEHQFRLPIGKVKSSKKQFSVKTYSQHFFAVIGVLEWEDGFTPQINLAPDHPIVISLDGDNFWALLPLAENNSEE